MQAGAAAVVLEAVTKRYGADTVVDAVSVSIAQGEFFTLLGPSGSGKTTTLNMLAGFAEPDGGRVLLGGRDVTRAAPRERGLGMVFQNYAIFPHLDTFENVAFPLRVKKAPKREVEARVAEALAMVKLTGFERRYARQLSGGQQQRVALARAIVAQPRVVLMDEPLGALDKNLRYHMQVEIKDIQRRLGMTVVYVTHDQEEALTMSDRIAIMNGGRIVQMGPPRHVYEAPESAFVGRFLGEANLIPARRNGSAVVGEGGALLDAAHGRLGAEDGFLFVRPEKIAVAPQGGTAPGGPNRIAGVVRFAGFLGNVLRCEVETDDVGSLIADLVNGPGAVLHAAGDKVVLSWSREDCRLLPG